MKAGEFRSERLGAVDLGSRARPVRCWFCCGAGIHIEGSGLMTCVRCEGTGVAHLGALVVTEYDANRLKHFALWGE